MDAAALNTAALQIAHEAATAVQDIESFIQGKDPDYQNWYIGITDDADRRRGEHKAHPDHFIAVPVKSILSAHAVKRILTNRHHTLSRDRGGNDRSKVVYAFRMTSETTPRLDGEAIDWNEIERLVVEIEEAMREAKKNL